MAASETSPDDVVVHCGVKLPIDPAIMSGNIRSAITSGSYEHQEAKEIGRLIQEGERVLEIGGGIGFMSTLIARNGLTARVRVIEANPDLIPFIERVHKLNEVADVEVINAVLSNDMSNPTLPFYLRKDFWASSLSPQPFGFIRTVDVPVRSFNSEIETFKPTLIVCDIEGGELDLFMNANLTGVKKVYMEIHQKVLGRGGIKRLFDALSARNFHYDQHHSRGSVVLFSHIQR